MPILNSSCLGVGPISTSIIYFHPQFNLLNGFSTNYLPFYSLHTYNNNNNNSSCYFKKKLTINNNNYNKYSVNASAINSSSGVGVDQLLDDSDGSPPPFPSLADWEAAKTYKENGTIYEGRIEGFNNGGLLVQFYSLVGFLPFPQLSPSHCCKEPNKTVQHIARGLIGSVIQMKVIEADMESKKLIFSEKEATWSNYSEKVKVGDVLEGRVGLVEDYGAFIYLRFPDGNYHLTGLVHVSEVSWDYVQDVRDVLSTGNEVKVKVTQIDREKSRITLSIRQLEEDPLFETLDKVISQDDGTSPEVTSTSTNSDIQPLPGLEEILKELSKEEGITDVRIRRQGFEKRVVSQDLQLWLSNAPQINNQFTILARAGRQVQEVQLTTSLDQEGIKKALQRVLERLP